MINSITVKDVKTLSFPKFSAKDETLSIFDENDETLPFEIKRVFSITSHHCTKRGNHAHKSCEQILIASIGTIKVIYSDGNKEENILLDDPSIGLYIPPGIWAEQDYQDTNSVLTVLCSESYDEEEYIRDYNEFLLEKSKQS